MRLGIMLVSGIFVLSLAAPLFLPPSHLNFDLKNRLQGPSLQHILGTDENGSDVFTKIVYGGRLSIIVSLSVVTLSAAVGLAIGTVAGYRQNFLESTIVAVIELFQSFPGFLVALAIMAFMGPSLVHLIFSLCLTSWTAYARLVRSEVQKLMAQDFVTAARASGVSAARIVVHHLWPNVLGLLAVQMSLGLAGAVISESGLSFLGLGVPPNVPSWGALLNSGRRYLISAPTLSVFPGLAIVILVLGFNMMADGLRTHFDPKGA